MQSNNEKYLTGYPHIDKPWMQWYQGMNLNINNPNTNITDYLKQFNVNRRNFIAETYYGNEISYDEIFQKSDDASKALSAIGVNKGNILFNLVPTIPEAGQIWLVLYLILLIQDQILWI